MSDSLGGETGGVISVFLLFITGLIGLLFPPERRPIFLFSFSCLLGFLQRDLRHFRLLPVSADLTPLFFSNSALYGVAVMIFAEPHLEDLASLVSCFEIEGSGQRLAAVTVMFVEAVGVAEVDGGVS